MHVSIYKLSHKFSFKYLCMFLVICLMVSTIVLFSSKPAHDSIQYDVYIITGQSNSLGTTGLETDYAPGTDMADANMASFEANNSGHMWGHLRDTVNVGLAAIVAQGNTFNVKGLIYVQGESNSASKANIVDSRLSTIITNVHTTLLSQELTIRLWITF